MNNILTNSINAGHGNALLVAAVIGLVASDVIPTPGDALYFWDQQRLKKMLEAKQITAKQFWVKNALGYYSYNGLWWLLLGLTVIYMKGSFDDKIKLGIALAGSGAVIAVLAKNIQKDKTQIS